jgi:hypothetical protein
MREARAVRTVPLHHQGDFAMRSIRFAVAFALLPLGMGCTTVLGPNATPPDQVAPSFFAPAHYADKAFENAAGALKNEMATPLTPAGRDFVVKHLRAIDKNYAAYSSWLSSDRANIDTIYESTGLGVTALSAISTVTSVKTALAAAGTFTQGQKSSIDKNYYQGKVIHTLVNVMEVTRTELRGKLRRALLNDTYTLQEAMFDLEEYYRAGTLDTALSSASITAATVSAPEAPASAADTPAPRANGVKPAAATTTRSKARYPSTSTY